MESTIQTETANPYKPPHSVPDADESGQRTPSVYRGLLVAVPASIIGFATPYAALAAITLSRFAFFEYPAVDRNAYLRELPSMALMAAIACSLVFGLAAFVNSAPAQRFGFVRALMFVGLSALFGLFITAVVTAALGIGPRRGPDPYFVARFLLAMVVPIVTAFVILNRVIRQQDCNS